MLRNHSCRKCGNTYVTANPFSVYCDICVLTRLGELELKSPPPEPKAVTEVGTSNAERDEIAKEIFKILTIDLVKAAMESPKTANAFRTIMEANCKTAFMHADLFMEQKNKCPNKSESN